jgi:hypothetical protein
MSKSCINNAALNRATSNFCDHDPIPGGDLAPKIPAGKAGLFQALGFHISNLAETALLEECLNRTFIQPEGQVLPAHETITAHVVNFLVFRSPKHTQNYT